MLGIVGLSACSLVTAGALPALPTVTFNDDTGVITFENGNTCHQGQFLGSGAYGTVYVVDGLPPDAPPMVVKWQINKDAYVAWDTDFLNELRIHLLLQCSELSRRPLLCVPEIVFAGTVANRPGVGLTIMHHGGITLEDYMGRHKKRPSMALNILIHLCSVFATLQEQFAFVHRDLKPNNILVRICEDDPSKDEPVLIDFGTSRLKIPSCECTKPKGQGRGGACKRCCGLVGACFEVNTKMYPKEDCPPVNHSQDLASLLLCIASPVVDYLSGLLKFVVQMIQSKMFRDPGLIEIIKLNNLKERDLWAYPKFCYAATSDLGTNPEALKTILQGILRTIPVQPEPTVVRIKQKIFYLPHEANKALMAAIEDNDAQIAEHLLTEWSADLDFDRTQYAISAAGTAKLLSLLLPLEGVDTQHILQHTLRNKTFETPDTKMEIVGLLLEHVHVLEPSTFQYADDHTLPALLSRVTDPDGLLLHVVKWSPRIQKEKMKLTICKALMARVEQHTKDKALVQVAERRGAVDVIRCLVDGGGSVDSRGGNIGGMSPLMHMLDWLGDVSDLPEDPKSRLDLSNLVLQMVNKTKYPSIKDDYGITVLMFAARANDYASYNALVAKGGDETVRFDGKTAREHFP